MVLPESMSALKQWNAHTWKLQWHFSLLYQLRIRLRKIHCRFGRNYTFFHHLSKESAANDSFKKNQLPDHSGHSLLQYKTLDSYHILIGGNQCKDIYRKQILTFVRTFWNSSSLVLASLYFLQFMHRSYISSICSKGESFKTQKQIITLS